MNTENPFKVQFRPGESNEQSIKAKQESERKEAERTKDFAPADRAEEVFASMLAGASSYSETFRIMENGEFDIRQRLDGLPMFMQEASTPLELYQLAQDVQKKHPKYKFGFETDPEGKWMKYTVSKTETGK